VRKDDRKGSVVKLRLAVLCGRPEGRQKPSPKIDCPFNDEDNDEEDVKAIETRMGALGSVTKRNLLELRS